MLESVIVLRDSLDTLPGGFRDTTAVYRYEAEGKPTSIEHYSPAQMFVERALFNRNSLLGCLPEDVFSDRLALDRERLLVYRCALAEFGASAFQKRGVDLETLSGDELKRARESYGNSPLRLHDKSEDKIRDEFCKGWPPASYDKKTLDLIEAVRSEYGEVFSEDKLERFLEAERRELQRYEGMAPGPEAFKKILQTERGQDSLLWGLDLWDTFDDDPSLGKPPVEELVYRLGQSFRKSGYHESTVEYFERTTLESFDEYMRSFFDCSSLWNARKGAVIYNIVISSFFGPKSALKNCYSDEIAKTQIADYIPRDMSVTGPLKQGGGEAVIRQILPGGVIRVVDVVNLDNLPENEPCLIAIVGREYGGEVRYAEWVGDPVLEAAKKLSKNETEANFYPTDLPADSARHMGLYSFDGVIYIIDLASSNGTTIVRPDGTTVHLGRGAGGDHPYRALAHRGDRVFLGDSEFELL